MSISSFILCSIANGAFKAMWGPDSGDYSAKTWGEHVQYPEVFYVSLRHSSNDDVEVYDLEKWWTSKRKSDG